jgi:hypothetical protein
MKRCIIELPKFRISKPGYDVDTASMENLIFHESMLFTQPYFFQFVACPFSGAGNLTGTVSVTVPDVTSDPIVLLFLSGGSTVNVYPGIRSEGPGNNEDGYDVTAWSVRYNVVSSTRIDVTFSTSLNGKTSPAGAHMILMRKS